jgi:hypothetical protein
MLFLKFIYVVIRPKKVKNRVKMLKNRLFEVEKKSTKCDQLLTEINI